MNVRVLQSQFGENKTWVPVTRRLLSPARSGRLTLRRGLRQLDLWHRPLGGAAGVAVVAVMLGATSVVGLWGAGPALSAPDASSIPSVRQSLAKPPTYLQDVLPIFMGKCATCHNDHSAIYNWMDYRTAYEHRWEIKRRVWDSWHGRYYKQPMPAGNTPECLSMTEADRELIKDWVEAGAVRGSTAGAVGSISPTVALEHGKQLFSTICALCHQPTGQGVPDKFPPLAGSDYLNADKARAIRTVLNGRQGTIVVNGHAFNNSMPSFPLSDDDIAAVLSYVYHSFGNSGQQVAPAEVAALRGQKEEQPVPSANRAVAKAPAEKNPYE